MQRKQNSAALFFMTLIEPQDFLLDYGGSLKVLSHLSWQKVAYFIIFSCNNYIDYPTLNDK